MANSSLKLHTDKNPADKSADEIVSNVARSAPGMLAYWDKDLVCRFANEAYLEWFGIAPEDMIDKMLLKTVLGHLYEKNLPYITGALNGKKQLFERSILTPSGITKIARAHYIPDIVNGSVNGFYVQVVDVSPLTNIDTVDRPGIEKELSKLSITDNLLNLVVETLKSCVFTGFPGITKLSKKHYISESKLKRDFKNKYNTTIFSFYRNLQMDVAFQYITDRKYTKKQMALMLNFSNPSNFSSCYKSYLKEKDTKEQNSKIKKIHYDLFKTFVEQAGVDIAMLDNNLAFIAASQRYLDTWKINANEYIGKCIYDVIPETQMMYKGILQDCLNGNTNVTKEAFIERADGVSFWLNWEIKPWYTADKQIGGLLISTENITAEKLKEVQNKQLTEILEKTSEIARIGAWSRDFKTNIGYYNKVLKEILEVPEDYIPPDIRLSIGFYKEGYSRQLIEKVITDARKKGESFDVTVEIITAKGNQKTVRAIGYPEFHDGVCDKISGIYIEIPDYI